MTPDDIATMALALPGTVEAAHFGKRDFRAPKIFLSLPSPGIANLNLAPDQQAMFVELYPEVFSPLPNAWGLRGWTSLRLDACTEETARMAVEAAWKTVVSKRPRDALT